MTRLTIPSKKISSLLIYTNVIVACIYFSWWFLPRSGGNPYLYTALLVGEVYHVLMATIFWFTIFPSKNNSFNSTNNTRPDFAPSVDVYITVAGEPTEIVRKTVQKACEIDYPNFKVYILNDSYVAGKESWHDIEKLASEYKAICITRKTPGGAKAGNINHALSRTSGDLIAVLDADMVPHPTFLKKLVPYFINTSVGFVQSPQYYINHKSNEISAGAWEQQELFFGAIMKGKDKDNAAFICGTNFVVRRAALESVGGFNTQSIAEDILTSLLIHQKGWRSHYVDEVLCEGLGPEDLLSYYKQQRRWGFGSLTLLFRHNPFLKRGLTLRQKIHYFSSVLFYLNGIVVAIDILMPLIYFYFGLRPVAATTTSFAIFFIPYIFLILFTLYEVSGRSITFRAMAFSQSSWFLQIQTFFENLLRFKVGFDVTPKKAQTGNYIFLAFPHIAYVFLGVIGMGIALFREGINPSIITNIAWFIFNSFMFLPYIKAAYSWEKLFGRQPTVAYKYNP